MSIIKITITPVVYNLVKANGFGYGFKIKGFDGVWEHCGKDPSTGKEVILQLNEGNGRSTGVMS